MTQENGTNLSKQEQIFRENFKIGMKKGAADIKAGALQEIDTSDAEAQELADKGWKFIVEASTAAGEPVMADNLESIACYGKTLGWLCCFSQPSTQCAVWPPEI